MTKPHRLQTQFSNADDSTGLVLWRVTNAWQAAQRRTLKPFGPHPCPVRPTGLGVLVPRTSHPAGTRPTCGNRPDDDFPGTSSLGSKGTDPQASTPPRWARANPRRHRAGATPRRSSSGRGRSVRPGVLRRPGKQPGEIHSDAAATHSVRGHRASAAAPQGSRPRQSAQPPQKPLKGHSHRLWPFISSSERRRDCQHNSPIHLARSEGFEPPTF